jgi:predicted ATPase/RsiW-degrading membrane proteinase PrsW (M82 family)
MIASLGEPAFYLTLAMVQAVVVLIGIRLFDRYEPEPLVLIGLVALWGATGAAAISIAGNRAVKGALSGNVQTVFGDAVSAPLVEESAKGLALLAAVLPLRWIAKRFGISVFEGLNDGLVYGAAVGLGFALTEDFTFFVDRASSQGLGAGIDLFVSRRDFFGPAVLHHAIFTAAFGAGLGLATWTTRRSLKILFPLAGFALALLMHGANNGLLELGLTLKYGLNTAAAWVAGGAVQQDVIDTANTWNGLLGVLDYFWVIAFLTAAILWVRYEGRVIRAELVEEVDSGLITPTDAEAVTSLEAQAAHAWHMFQSGQLEQWRHERTVQNAAARLALLKWRTERFGGDRAAIGRARRQLATLVAFQPRPSKIPVPPTPIVGREAELGEAAELLRKRDLRVLTLTGPGGTGKTRLSIELANRVQERYPSGVFFVALAGATDADAVVAALVETLELREQPGRTPLELVSDDLRDKHLLLVLDNLEQVVLAAAGPLAEILEAAPRVQVVATSREPLHMRSEQELPVGPLHDDEAVELFVTRARAIDLGFAPTGANESAIKSICMRMSGLPLAIELAAARTNVLTPVEIADRLDRSLLGTSEAGASDAPSRHQTLRAAIEWSYDLLADGERALLAQLGVFTGGFDVDAAEAIGGEVLGPLGSLVDKSLVRRTLVEERPRFELLEAIRQFALERLDGDAPASRGAHARYFVGLAEQAEAELRGAEQAAWLRRLGREHDNLRAAFAWLVDAASYEEALRLATALGPFWEQRGTLGEPRAWLEGVLSADGAVPPPLRARALYAAGRLAMLQADYADAEAALGQASDLYRGLGGDELVRCQWELGFIALVRGDYDRALHAFEESLSAARALGDPAATSRSLASVGRALTERGDVADARPPLRESLAIRRGADDTRNVANSLSLLGRRALVADDLSDAHEHLDEAVSLARDLDDKLRLAEALYFRALVALEEGDSTAHTLLAERIEVCRELGDRLGIAECLDAEARVSADDVRAAQLFAAAEHLRSTLGAAAWPFEQRAREAALAALRVRLTGAAFDDAAADGAALSLEGAVALALGAGDAEGSGARMGAAPLA